MFTWPFHLITSIPSATVAGQNKTVAAQLRRGRAGRQGGWRPAGRPPSRGTACRPRAPRALPRHSINNRDNLHSSVLNPSHGLTEGAASSPSRCRASHVGTALRSADSRCQHHKTWPPSKTHDRQYGYWDASYSRWSHRPSVHM